jgi:hypothetical protein
MGILTSAIIFAINSAIRPIANSASWALVLMIFTLGCGGNQESSFLSEASTSGTCSSSGCAVNDSAPYLTVKRSSTYYVKKMEREIEINGECYVGPDAVSNSIELSIVPAVSASVRGINVGDPGDSGVHCSLGKFSFIMIIDALSVGLYKLSGNLNMFKADGSTIPSKTANFTINVSVSK